MKNGAAESEDRLLIEKRLKELSDRSFSRGIFTETEFLTPASLAIALRLQNSGEIHPVTFFGLFPNAERNIAVFGSEKETGYTYDPPIDCLAIEPLSEKFGEELHHRDVLGAILSLGVRRESIGDILPDGKTAYVAVLRILSPFIQENLKRIRHTDVAVTAITSLPEIVLKEPDPSEFFVSSQRIDCLVAAVWHLSRNNAKELFDKERIFLNSSLIKDPAASLKTGDMISVRGFGRFRYLGTEKETKKHRLLIKATVWR